MGPSQFVVGRTLARHQTRPLLLSVEKLYTVKRDTIYGARIRRRRIHQLRASRQRRAGRRARRMGDEPAARPRGTRRAAVRRGVAHLVGSQAPGERLLL